MTSFARMFQITKLFVVSFTPKSFVDKCKNKIQQFSLQRKIF